MFIQFKTLFWNHGLIVILVIFTIIPIITANTIETSLFEYKNSILGASLYIIISLMLILKGYCKQQKHFKIKTGIRLTNSFLITSIFLCLFGLIIAYKTLISVTNFSEYQNLVENGGNVSDIREEMGSGGLSGIFKMFACAPLCVFLMSSGLYFFNSYSKSTRKVLIYSITISLICTLGKVAIFFDRLSLLAIIFVFTYHLLYNQVIKFIHKCFFICCLMSCAGYITILRMNGTGLIEFLSVYFNLGVINLQVLLNKQESFNYNFTQSFLAPLGYICRFFHLRFPTSGPCDWVWNPAGTFWTVMFIDFNYFSLLLMPIAGKVIRRFQLIRHKSTFASSFYFVLMYCLFSFCTVPIIRSIEFWLMIVIIYIYTKLLIHKTNEVKS